MIRIKQGPLGMYKLIKQLLLFITWLFCFIVVDSNQVKYLFLALKSTDDDEIETDSGDLSPTLMCGSPSPSPSDVSDEFSSGSVTTCTQPVHHVSTASQTSFLFPSLTSSTNNKLPFIDLSMWRREEICCGTIFRGPHGEVLVDPKLLNPMCTCSCSARPPVNIGEAKTVKQQQADLVHNKIRFVCIHF